MIDSQCITLYISNGGQSAKNETNMNKTNGSAKMKVSAVNPATTHTLTVESQKLIDPKD